MNLPAGASHLHTRTHIAVAMTGAHTPSQSPCPQAVSDLLLHSFLTSLALAAPSPCYVHPENHGPMSPPSSWLEPSRDPKSWSSAWAASWHRGPPLPHYMSTSTCPIGPA